MQFPTSPLRSLKEMGPSKNRCYFYTSGSIYVSGPRSIIPPLFAKTGPAPSVLALALPLPLVSVLSLERGARRRRQARFGM